MDGTTINEPYWSSRGSPNAEDSYEVDLGRPTRFDDVRLYFYRDRTADGLNEPARYRVQYHDGDGWVDVPRQARTPAIPGPTTTTCGSPPSPRSGSGCC